MRDTPSLDVPSADAPPAPAPTAWRAWTGLLGLLGPAVARRHRVAEGVWRSGQPGPGRLRAFARSGGRTVISLRAGEAVPALPAEIAACRELGLVFRRLKLRGHRLPSRAELSAARQLFAAAERPVLLHCQSGADRAGFAAALWLLFEDRPPAEARRQLSPRYGHNPLGRAGVFDAFLDACAASPLPFADWVETAYDPERITAAWRDTGLAGRFRLWLARR